MTKNIISIHYGHNCTVGLSQNGKMVCVVSEERFNRIKNATGFPFNAYKYVIEHYLSGNPENIDKITINDELLKGYDFLEKEGFEPKHYNSYFIFSHSTAIPDWWENDLSKFTQNLLDSNKADISNILKNKNEKNRKLSELSKLLKISKNKIVLLNHHYAHAYSCAWGLAENNRHLVFTLDAVGDNLCATINILYKKKLTNLLKIHNFNSPGYIYRETTGFLGMKPDEHEFKVMGLAPYADEKQADRICKKFDNILWLTASGSFQSKFPTYLSNYYLLQNFVYERFDNISGGLQKFTEKLLVSWISFWVAKTKIPSIALSGGVFMNVKAVQKIAEMPEVKSLFVMPSSSDESLVFGGCYAGSLASGIKLFSPLRDLYLGQNFDDKYITEFIKKNNINTKYTIKKFNENDIAVQVAKLLKKNFIVALFNGKEEWGARALGNRSIIANPSSFRNIAILNKKIKSRDFWMPFAPSILEEDIDEYIVNPKKIYTPYMSITFDSTPRARKEIIAALHPEDLTLRPQAVKREWNPRYHAIISEFKKITGISGVLNTSFNLHGEPNVSSPADAIHTVDNSGLEYLVMGNYLLAKRTRADVR
ncbi:MAG TPA: carbamoyltransferase [Spirochaetia bacterium]|nr:carbamoyltransferase [Spirochaetia bacterium]